MENQEEDEITEGQRQRAEANRARALAKRKAILSLSEKGENGTLFKCRKLSSDATITVAKQPLTSEPTGPCQRPEKFRARLEICSPDSFSVTPVAIEGFEFPGEDVCFEKLRDCFLNVRKVKVVLLKYFDSEIVSFFIRKLFRYCPVVLFVFM